MNSDSPGLIHKALDMGINHLDTASGYLIGNSEKAIGGVLQTRGNRGLSICQECSSCTAACRNGIHINSRLKSLIAEKIHLG